MGYVEVEYPPYPSDVTVVVLYSLILTMFHP
jgi:hypothetical protein